MDNKLRESFLKDINREISKINNLVNTMLKYILILRIRTPSGNLKS